MDRNFAYTSSEIKKLDSFLDSLKHASWEIGFQPMFANGFRLLRKLIARPIADALNPLQHPPHSQSHRSSLSLELVLIDYNEAVYAQCL